MHSPTHIFLFDSIFCKLHKTAFVPLYYLQSYFYISKYRTLEIIRQAKAVLDVRIPFPLTLNYGSNPQENIIILIQVKTQRLKTGRNKRKLHVQTLVIPTPGNVPLSTGHTDSITISYTANSCRLWHLDRNVETNLKICAIKTDTLQLNANHTAVEMFLPTPGYEIQPQLNSLFKITPFLSLNRFKQYFSRLLKEI